MVTKITVKPTAYKFFVFVQGETEAESCLCSNLADEVIAVLFQSLHDRLYHHVQAPHLVWLVVLDEVSHAEYLDVLAKVTLDLHDVVHHSENGLYLA